MGFFTRKPRGVTLYHPGPMATARLPRVVKATKELLRDLGIEFIMIDELQCCGYHAWYAGYEREFKAHQSKVQALLKAHHVTRIITNDPHCAYTFKQRYGLETRHILQVLEEHIDKLRRKDGLTVNYHHGCFLDKLGIEDKTAIRVLRRANFHVPKENKSGGCCGSVGDDYARNNPELAAKIADRRGAECKERATIVACPYCYVALQRHKEVRDITEVVGER